ncbi:MAG: hypothetical protein N2444_05340 [Methylocystis sp.]|nr:hypothetical protein [Methylocystis sp.]
MRPRALCFGSVILVALGFGLAAARAQEATFDPKALDASGAASAPKAKAAKKPKAQAAAPAGKPGAQAGGPNRQFGELEGWSPGKAPPKPGEKDSGLSGPPKGTGIGVSPSGNMSVGLPF